MAIPFLNNINLDDNQLQNAKLHVTSSAPAAEEGQIYFHSTNDVINVHDGSAWKTLAYQSWVTANYPGTVTSVSSATTNQLTITNETTTPSLTIVTGAVANGGTALATGDQIYDFVIGLGYTSNIGDITGVNITAGNGLTGTVNTTSGDHVQTIDVVGGDGITANADEIEVSVDDTTIELSASDGTGVVRAKTAAIADGGTGLATADQIHTFVTGYADPAGTDNSTNVTLAGALDYITISGQEITRNAIDLTTDVTGALPIANGGTGQTTAAAAADALLNTSQGGSLTIGDASDGIIIPGNLTVTGTTTTNNVETVSTSNGVVFEGNVAADGNELTLLAGTLTADRTITLPNATGTVALTSDLHDAVTLAGSYDYITLAGQVLTLNQIDYTTDIANTPTIPSPANDATITVSAGTGLSGGGDFTTDQATNETITLSHADTSSQASVNNSGVTVIQDVTLDTYGHVTGLASVDLTSGINSLIDTKISATGYAATITDSVSGTAFDHGLGEDVIVQLYDLTTKETVYADVVRNGNYLEITFASTPTNSIRVLVQKIN